MSSVFSDQNKIRIGKNIRLLRRRAHLSQGELAEKLGIRQSPLSNLERGKHLPSTQVLLKIAEVFGVTVDQILSSGYLITGSQGKASNVDCLHEIRENQYNADSEFQPSSDCFATTPLARHPGKELAGKLESVAQDILALEDICDVPRCARIPLRMSFNLTEGDIIRLAMQMRQLLGINDTVVFDYLELFENHGLRVLFMNLGDVSNSLSYFDARYSNVFIFLSTDINSEKQIFLLAYELGRILLYARLGAMSGENSLHEKQLDKLARLFAANFLMPADVVQCTVMQIGVLPDEWDYPLLLRLKHRFGVSAESFNYRLLELGLIAEELQTKFREMIQQYYKKYSFSEPGDSRRILSPNGRLGDLLYLALKRGEGEAQEIGQRFKRLKIEVG
ncbi:MAG: helix-turn-helix domain-containing protein [Lentisphaerae bacterium]|nr:helix-turn-helix domain-containing protein [Lentisphaerota bacterium]